VASNEGSASGDGSKAAAAEAGGALGGKSGSGDYGPAQGSGARDFAGDSNGGSTTVPEPASQVDDGRRPSSGRGATTGASDGGVDGGPGGRTAGSRDRGGAG